MNAAIALPSAPTSGAPYLDKPKFHITAQSFASARLGYCFSTRNRLEYKHDGRTASLDITPEGYRYENDEVRVLLGEDYAARKAELKGKVMLVSACVTLWKWRSCFRLLGRYCHWL